MSVHLLIPASVLGIFLWKHAQSCSKCSMVTKCGSYRLFGGFFLYRLAASLRSNLPKMWIFHKVWGDLLLVGPREILRLKVEQLGAVEDMCQHFWRNSYSKCPKWVCKFRALEIFEKCEVIHTVAFWLFFGRFYAYSFYEMTIPGNFGHPECLGGLIPLRTFFHKVSGVFFW